MVPPWTCTDYRERAWTGRIGLLRLRETFPREKLSATLDDPHSDRVHVRIHYVGAMVGRAQKLSLNGFDAGTLNYVFREPYKMRSGLRDSRSKRRLTWKPMLRRAMLCHQGGVPMRRHGQGIVPLQCRQCLRPARPVQRGKQFLFCSTSAGLRSCQGKRCKSHDQDSCQPERDSHVDPPGES